MVSDSIEEKMIERAELKLRMDAAVIQQGRLADKAKSMSKEDAIQAIRYGADKIFKVRPAASPPELARLSSRGSCAGSQARCKVASSHDLAPFPPVCSPCFPTAPAGELRRRD